MENLAPTIEHEEMGISIDGRVLGKKFLVLVIQAHIDLDGHVELFDKRCEVVV